MKFLKQIVPGLAVVAATLFAGAASAADEKEDLLTRFDRELLILMSGFAEAHEAGVSSTFRQEYLSTFDAFVKDANRLQEIAVGLGIGEDLNIATHARNIRTAFQTPPAMNASTGIMSNRKDKEKDKKSGTTNDDMANNPLYRLTGKTLSDHADVMASSIPQKQSTVGFSFHMAGSAVQTLSSLGFRLRDGKYTVSPRYRRILPYLELKRDVEYFNASYEHFDSLIEVGVWRTDFEKRLSRMTQLAAQVQPVYRAYFPKKTGSVITEADRLSRVYKKFIEYMKAVDQANTQSSRLSSSTNAFDQIRQSNIPDKGLILKDYDTAAAYFAEFFADMDSIDWTVNPFSESGPAKDGAAKTTAKKKASE